MSLILGYTEDNASVMYHLFSMLCYFTPVFGAIIADTYLGKFKWVSRLFVNQTSCHLCNDWSYFIQDHPLPVDPLRSGEYFPERRGHSGHVAARVRQTWERKLVDIPLTMRINTGPFHWSDYWSSPSAQAESNPASRHLVATNSSGRSRIDSWNNSSPFSTCPSMLDH